MQQLAIVANNKKEKTWQELVPQKYHKFGSIFSEKDSKRFPGKRKWDHAIDLKPEAPMSIDCHIYPLSPKEKEEQKEFLAENLRLHRICHSNSPYASGFFLIRKKDGKFQPVQDYRNLNKWTIPNQYPLPLIDDLIYDLAGYRLFSKFHVRWGYNNIRIKKGDKWKAAFKTSEGRFEPMGMFFGLTNSPATFQTMMDDIFRSEIALGYVIIYMDDILIATQGDLKDHQKHVAYILNVLQQHDLYLKPEKCSFHKKEVEYLGVIVGNGKVKMDPIKVQALTDWPQPTTLKQLRSFLGFGNYYKDFIKDYSQLARPLHEMTKKNVKYLWQEPQQQAFETLKHKFTSYPVLRNPDPSKHFILDTDASAHAVGASLSQEFDDGFHPTAYFSKSLTAPERNYDIYDRELLSIIYAVKAF